MLAYGADKDDRDGDEQDDAAHAYRACVHLRDVARQAGVDLASAALAPGMKTDKLERIEQRLREALRKLKDRPCHIGPYAGGFCTICGLRQP